MITEMQEKLQRHLGYLEQDKNNPNLLLSIGLLKAKIYHHKGQLKGAIAELDTLRTHHEGDAEVAGLLALLHFDNQDLTQANLFSNTALALNPTQYEGLLVDVFLRAMEHKSSISEIDALIAINPNDCRTWFALGTLYMQHMNLPAAEHAFLQASIIWPQFYDNWICLGWCYLLQNKLDLTEKTYQNAVSIDEDRADGWSGIALVCALQNNLNEAEKWLQKADMLDATCFLAAITRIVLAHSLSTEKVCTQFNSTFPEIGFEINRILAQAILAVNATS